MGELGYVVAGYAVTIAALAGYVIHLRRRLGKASSGEPSRP